MNITHKVHMIKQQALLSFTECWIHGLEKQDTQNDGSNNGVASCQRKSSAMGLGASSLRLVGLGVGGSAASGWCGGELLHQTERLLPLALPAMGQDPSYCGVLNQPHCTLHGARAPTSKAQAQ